MLMTDGKYYVEIELKVWESFDIGYSERYYRYCTCMET